MVEGNAEVVRRWIEAFHRGDPGALVEGIGPEAEWVVAREHPAAAASGAGTGVALVTVSTFRDGRPVRTEEFLDPDEARRRFAS
jgi:ketosteroid isomerase-like protein